jgi:hypothetical protein
MPTYKAHSIKFHVDGASAVILPDITSQGLEQNPNLMAELTAAYATPTHVAYVARKVLGNCQTFALATALGTIGAAGLCITSATNPGIVIYFQQFDDNGCPVSGSFHRSLTIRGGLIVPKTLSISHQQDGQLTFDIAAVKYSTNAIVTISDTAALPSITVASARWTLGPISIAGVALREYDEFDIDFGNNVETRAVESNVDDTHVSNRTHEPTITIKGIDPTWFSSGKIPLGGAVALNASDYVMLRQRSQDANNFAADAGGTHIKLKIAGLAANTSLRGQAQRPTENSIVIKLARDSSGNAPLVLDLAANMPS